MVLCRSHSAEKTHGLHCQVRKDGDCWQDSRVGDGILRRPRRQGHTKGGRKKKGGQAARARAGSGHVGVLPLPRGGTRGAVHTAQRMDARETGSNVRPAPLSILAIDKQLPNHIVQPKITGRFPFFEPKSFPGWVPQSTARHDDRIYHFDVTAGSRSDARYFCLVGAAKQWHRARSSRDLTWAFPSPAFCRHTRAVRLGYGRRRPRGG